MDRLSQKGYFVTFEGGEGSGKTTQLGILAEYLIANHLPVITTREPGGTKLGDRIRELILNGDSSDPEIDSKAELFLYLASRAQHMTEIISPGLNVGKIVLCDRFTDATIAYQGDGRGLPKNEIALMTQFASYDISPTLTFFLDIPPSEGLSRLKQREEINRMDREALRFHEAVYRGYKTLARENPERIETIKATDSIQNISLKIRKRIDALLS